MPFFCYYILLKFYPRSKRDYNFPYEMLLKALTELLDCNPNAKVYIHNFSNFDYMFLIKVLFENFKVKPYFRNNKVINLVYQSKDNDKSKIYLFDSYLILPSSLRTLASKYKVSDQKGYFPYSFLSEDTLNYIGPTPSISQFNGISAEEYEGLISFTWNLRAELIRYLELDLKSLYQVINIFSRDIFNREKIDITKLPTISSIAFKIFRSNYLENSKLPIIKGTLPAELVGNGLGQFKLEHVINHGYFISPKLYALETIDGKLVVKAKGIGSTLEFNQFETLISNEAIVKAQDKWFKDPANANINIKNIIMHIFYESKKKTIFRKRKISAYKPNNNW